MVPDEKWTRFAWNGSEMAKRWFSVMNNNCVAMKMQIWLGVVFYHGADAVIRFEIGVDAVNRWRVLDWMCLGGLLV